MPSTKLDDLKPRFKGKVMELLARLVEARIEVVIIDTFRTQAEQDLAVKNGFSWTPHSLHQDGLAIDICPLLDYQLSGPNKLEWDTTKPVWSTIGKIGESLGLQWGVVINGIHKDLGHFQWIGVYAPDLSIGTTK